jgi:hypothetical protein
MNKLVKNTPPSNDLRGVDVTAPPSHRERDDAYRNVVAQLAPRWRVILQRKEASHGGPWRGVSYHTNRDGLLRACGSLEEASCGALEALEAFPDYASQLAKK